MGYKYQFQSLEAIYYFVQNLENIITNNLDYYYRVLLLFITKENVITPLQRTY